MKQLELTNDQLHTLRHMLGINTPYDREPRPYRDYAAVNPGDLEYLELERLGAVVHRAPPCVDSEYRWYSTTEAGQAAALRSHRHIRKRKPQRVYRRFLLVRDSFSELTFRKFLTDPEYSQYRAEA